MKQVRSTASDGRVGASVSSAIAGFGLERTREIRENLKIGEGHNGKHRRWWWWCGTRWHGDSTMGVSQKGTEEMRVFEIR